MRRLLLLAAAVLALAGPACLQGPIVTAIALTRDAAVWDRFEMRGFVWPPPANPFDPAQADVRGELEAPDGHVWSMPAFWTRDFERALAGGRERLTPRGDGEWRVRFALPSAGTWRWRWVAITPDGRAETPWRSFDVRPARAGARGPLRQSPDDARYLRFHDGAPYLAIGMNLCWYDARGTFAYDDWIAKLAAQGATYVRLWMPAWAFGLEAITRDASGAVTSNSIGSYERRLDRAWQLDHVMDLAAKHGLQVMLSIQNHGAFSLSANSEWADSAYNAANGGPLAHPADFFTDPTARELFRRRLRYVVARWGAAPNLLAFELWNEVDLAESPGVQPVRDWHVEMAHALRALDPHDHLVATSTTIAGDVGLYALPEIDLAQVHFYAYPGYSDLGGSVPFLLGSFAGLGKPALMAELGVDYRGPAETIARDPGGLGFHDGLWAGVMAPSFGTGMSWWWDNVIDPLDLWHHVGPVARATAGIAFDRESFASGGASAGAPGRSLRALALRGRTRTLVWVKNLADQWFPPGPDPSIVQGATLSLAGLPDGVWHARWIDTWTGDELAVQDVTVSGGALEIPAPPFARDVALRMDLAGAP